MAAFINVGPRKVYNQRRRYNDDVYRKLFRFNRENVDWLLNYFLDDAVETRGGALSPAQKMELFLRTLGDPGFQQGVAVDIGINQCTVSRSLVSVSEVNYSKRNNRIKFPNTDKFLADAMNEWANIKQMPRVIGDIDCTHIQITKPSIHSDEYVNRKGVCSINVQCTCNVKEMFTSVDAPWPGAVHDSRIWRNSVVYGIMYHNIQEAALLGDEVYGIAPWLLTLFKHPITAAQRNYNVLHARERVVRALFQSVETTFSNASLHYLLKIYIVSAFILQNISKHLRDPDIDFDPVEIEVQHQDRQIFEGNQGKIRYPDTQHRYEVVPAVFHNAIR